MRLYTFLVLALFALAARAANIPDNTPLSSITVSENVSDEKEPLDEANIINEVDNKLRTKPVETPVEVGEQKLQTNDESEEITRPAVDLRNPGPPQRQEHETQNPEFSAEQNIVQTYKQGLNNAHVFLKQGIADVSEGFQNVFGNNEQIKAFQDSIQKLRENFVAQINTLNGTVQTFLNGDETNSASPAQEQTKASVQIIESGLNSIKNDFTRGVNTLADSIESVKAENENPEGNNPSTSGTPAPVTLPPQLNPINAFQNIIQNIQFGFANLTNNVASIWNQQNQNNAQPAGAQSDDPNQATGNPPPGSWGSGSGPIMQWLQGAQNNVANFFQGIIPQPPKPEEVTQDPVTQRVTKPKEPIAQANPTVPITTTIGPIRQILQNNPVSQGIAATIQRIQNINNPEKPSREPTKVKTVVDILMSGDEKKGHSPGSGDNNNSGDDSGIKESEPVKEVQKESLPEEVAKPEKTEEVVEKTE